MILTYFQAGEAYLFTYIAFFVFIVLICKFLSESNLRKSSVLVENASKEKDKTEELLTNMLPHQALLELKQENFLTDRISYVTLMYADIVGFTAWSSTKEPKEVVGKLSQLFSTFDKLCLKHDVYKVHTIGDCYVVMGYKSDKNRNPAREALNVLCFAKSLVEVIEDCNTGEDYHLSMRVGIHTGEVIGGITGTNIVRYDIYGPDVLIANKMESNGQAGKVVVSESTMDIVLDYETDRFRFMYFKEIFVNVLNRVVKIFEVDDLMNRDLEEV
jgi:class 3 adenylate cyclase